MAMYQLPLTNENYNYKFRLELGLTTYVLGIRWNARMNAWVMDLMTEEEVPIVMGIKLVLNQFLFSRFIYSNMPEGALFVVNTEDDEAEPDDENLGSDAQVMYLEQ